MTAASTPSLEALALAIADWQRVTFPHATAASVATHLAREAAELVREPTDPSEIADVFHLLVASAAANGSTLSALVDRIAVTGTASDPTPGASLDTRVAIMVARQARTAPDATPVSRAVMVDQMAARLLREPTNVRQITNVFYFLVASAVVNGYTLAEIVATKFAENQGRIWGAPDADGVVEHVTPVPRD